MRLYNWEARLTAYVGSVAREGFCWGRHDCALFAAGAVEAVTGTDPAAAFRGRYTTLKGGLRVIRAAGFADQIAAARASYPTIVRSAAMPGDLAVIGTGRDAALGVVQGAMIYALRAEGLGLVPLESAAEYLGVR